MPEMLPDIDATPGPLADSAIEALAALLIDLAEAEDLELEPINSKGF